MGACAFSESLIISQRGHWVLCKVAYALKLAQIIFCLYQLCGDRTQQEMECNAWLNTPAHDIARTTTEDRSAYRPLTQSFFCNFERVHEDKTKRDTTYTVQYYQFNYTIQNVLASIEVVYCFLCMFLFLMIIYWVQEGKEEIVLGVDSRGARIQYSKRRSEMTD